MYIPPVPSFVMLSLTHAISSCSSTRIPCSRLFSLIHLSTAFYGTYSASEDEDESWDEDAVQEFATEKAACNKAGAKAANLERCAETKGLVKEAKAFGKCYDKAFTKFGTSGNFVRLAKGLEACVAPLETACKNEIDHFEKAIEKCIPSFMNEEDEEYEGKRFYSLCYVPHVLLFGCSYGCCIRVSAAFHVYSTRPLFCLTHVISSSSFIYSQPSMTPTLPARMRMRAGMRTRTRSIGTCKEDLGRGFWG